LSCAQCRQTRAHLRRQFGVRDGAEFQERPVVLDGRRLIARFVRHDGQVVMRPGAARIDLQRAP